ncbi:MAG TPA: HNH endonuclease signature motif containing protein [Candidatus Dormibacteraeota bacterium]|nr:HNH endonuclease signature motif containing protein [Candidatus Dormibacteraeota bacterium]
MKNKQFNAAQVWKEFEDEMVPKLRLSSIDHAVYSHLFRHSRLEAKPRIRFALGWLGSGTRLCPGTVRKALRRLFHTGAVRLIECNKNGHLVQVRLPDEIRALRVNKSDVRAQTEPEVSLEERDFLQNAALRKAVHDREGGRCFYCLRRMARRNRCLDHVVPRASLGLNSYRNLVSCCQDCNTKKSDRAAEEFLRWLFREGKLNSLELKSRYSALRALKAGKLIPQIDSNRFVSK